MGIIGIGQHSYTESWKPNSGAKFSDALSFLEYAHSMGAPGVQVVIKPEEFASAPKMRARIEALGMWFEGNMGLPRTDADVEAFEAHAAAIKAAGGSIARVACLSGRRYETFKSIAEFNAFKDRSIKMLTRLEPILKKHQLRLAMENHKDWFASEHCELLNRIGSEWIGALVDVGNGISLLEDPYEVVETLSPLAVSTHIKDMDVREYEEGFLLSEVPLGSGFLDIPRMIARLRKANAQIHFNLEMITRDPLKVPCFTDAYYATCDRTPASDLAATLATVRRRLSAHLPTTSGLSPSERVALEDKNVRLCVEWAITNVS